MVDLEWYVDMLMYNTGGAVWTRIVDALINKYSLPIQ